MQILLGTAGDLPRQVMTGIARYRHKVFIDMLGWPLSASNGMELDQFDRPDARYVVAHDDHGAVIGTARLLPTTQPYLLGEVFPHLMGDQPAPCSDEVWELSRFAAVDFSLEKPLVGLGQFSSLLAVDLLLAAIKCAHVHKVNWLITVSPLGVERLLFRAGFRARRLAPPVIVDGVPIFACAISIETRHIS
jgi:acyl homoserine lactone synthase